MSKDNAGPPIAPKPWFYDAEAHEAMERRAQREEVAISYSMIDGSVRVTAMGTDGATLTMFDDKGRPVTSVIVPREQCTKLAKDIDDAATGRWWRRFISMLKGS